MAVITRPKRPIEGGDMDITPMIDCTFLLLIYFLLTSSFASKSPVTLPSAQHGAQAAEAEAIIITVARGAAGEAQIFLADNTKPENEAQGSPEDQEKAIQKYLADQSAKVSKSGNPRQNVLIKASIGLKQREMDRIEKAVARSDMEVQSLFIGITDRK